MLKKISIKLNHHLFFTSNWKLLPGLDQLSKLKYFNRKLSLKISPSIFSSLVKSYDYTEKSTRQRSSGTEVEGNAKTPSTLRTTELKFYPKPEAMSTKPVSEGTEIPSREVNTAIYTTKADTIHIHENIKGYDTITDVI